MDSCPFEGALITLLQADCAKAAAQTIAKLTTSTPGLSEKDRIEMSLERLSQRFNVCGGSSRSLKLGSNAMVINWSLCL